MHTIALGTRCESKAISAVTSIRSVTPEDQTQPKTYTATVVRRFEARAEVTFDAVGPVNSWDLAEKLKGLVGDQSFGAPVACGDLWVECVEEAEPADAAE